MTISAFIDRDVRFGEGVIVLGGEAASQLQGKRVFVVHSPNAFSVSGADAILPDLETQCVAVMEWTDFNPNTDCDDLWKGLQILQKFKADTIVGVGGGSAMDMSKLLATLQHVTDYDELQTIIRSGKAPARQANLILAPTTAGSGSEATRFAVVYIGHNKHSLEGLSVLPDTVLLDPALLASASPYQKATSGIDALAQGIEALWSIGSMDVESYSAVDFAVDAIDLIINALPEFVNHTTQESMRSMAVGSYLAGRAIDLTRTTAPHALSYAITKRFGPSHGHAVALTLGAVLERHCQAATKSVESNLQPTLDGEEFAERMDIIMELFGATDGIEARAIWEDLMRRIGLETSLTAVGVEGREGRESLVQAVNADRLGNNPVVFSSASLLQLLETIE